jgi:hypothetical protein
MRIIARHSMLGTEESRIHNTSRCWRRADRGRNKQVLVRTGAIYSRAVAVDREMT